MSDYIKREDAKQVATNMYLKGQVSVQFCNAIHSELNKKPSADVVEARHGHWEITDAYPHNVYCSECHKRFAQTQWAVWEDGSLPRKYCPNCGARMDREEQEHE